MSTATPCVDQAGEYVRQIVLDLRPMHGVKGAIDIFARESAVSFWKVRKLWNPNLQRHGFTLEADEHRDIKLAYFKFIRDQEAQLRARLDEIHRLRAERNPEQGDEQFGLEI